MEAIDFQLKRRQLIEDGFCVVENVMSPEMVARMRSITDDLVNAVSTEHKQQQRATGSMVPVMSDARMVDLVTHPEALRALEAMGFRENRFQSGYVISKPPHSPPLFWHFDWGGWSHPISFEKIPVQVFLMYYLTDTRRENGCLRAISGSHLKEHPLHDTLGRAHTDDLTRAQNLDRVEFQQQPQETDVPVKAGDLVIGDSRLLHASHANESDERRTVVTLWFHPEYPTLPDSIKGYIVKRVDPVPDDWPASARRRLESIQVTYDGTTEALPFSRQYIPKTN